VAQHATDGRRCLDMVGFESPQAHHPNQKLVDFTHYSTGGIPHCSVASEGNLRFSIKNPIALRYHLP
jgi:hypothetical protein